MSRSSFTSVAFSPDGRTLAGATSAGVVLWNVSVPADPRLLGTPLTPRSSFISVAFSPDGRTLASGSFDETVRLWDVADPARPQAIGGP